ncbi:TraB/GumN family protein [Escherichia coli]|nr:TraB/GumN family protein [Escherichia coli]
MCLLARRWKSALTRSNSKICSTLARRWAFLRRSFSTQPLWQIAMVLQATQAQKLGLRAEYGIDYQLLQAAKQQHKPVIELEGAENQITMLLQLPDKGLALLDDTLTHWHTNARLLQQMMSWWLNAPPQK